MNDATNRKIWTLCLEVVFLNVVICLHPLQVWSTFFVQIRTADAEWQQQEYPEHWLWESWQHTIFQCWWIHSLSKQQESCFPIWFVAKLESQFCQRWIPPVTQLASPWLYFATSHCCILNINLMLCHQWDLFLLMFHVWSLCCTALCTMVAQLLQICPVVYWRDGQSSFKVTKLILLGRIQATWNHQIELHCVVKMDIYKYNYIMY